MFFFFFFRHVVDDIHKLCFLYFKTTFNFILQKFKSLFWCTVSLDAFSSHCQTIIRLPLQFSSPPTATNHPSTPPPPFTSSNSKTNPSTVLLKPRTDQPTVTPQFVFDVALISLTHLTLWPFNLAWLLRIRRGHNGLPVSFIILLVFSLFSSSFHLVSIRRGASQVVGRFPDNLSFIQ